MNQKENIQLPSAPIQANVDLLINRELVGLGKYGVTLGDAGLSHAQLLQHALEEALDLSNYLQTALAAERENAGYKAEHALLMKKLRDRAGIYKMGVNRDRGDNVIRDLLRQYEIEAQRRGFTV